MFSYITRKSALKKFLISAFFIQTFYPKRLIRTSYVPSYYIFVLLKKWLQGQLFKKAMKKEKVRNNNRDT